MKAVIYARYSSDNQREESIESQFCECTAFAEKEGITILRHYIDRAFSARTDDRPEFKRMIEDSGKGLFDAVQYKLEKNKKAPAHAKAEEEYILTTKLYCGHCGTYMCGESGTSRNKTKYKYYKCMAAKKKGACKKKTVRKDWLEDLVVKTVWKAICDDDFIEAIVFAAMELQGKENTGVPLLETKVKELDEAIENILNAIQQGIFTKSTKERLEKLEAEMEEFEIRLSNEKMERPLILEEFIYRWLRRFRDLDVTLLEHRKMLIDNFVNSIYLYDDKILIGINHIDRVKEIKFSDLEQCSNIKTGRGSQRKYSRQKSAVFFCLIKGWT